MKLNQIRYFVKAVDTKSITQAAKLLYVSQPTLTTSIHSLEKELGVTLLVRTNKGVLPTSEGIIIYNDCKTILDTLEEKMESWKNLSSKTTIPEGIVHIGAAPAAYKFLIDTGIRVLGGRYPMITVIPHEMPAYQIGKKLNHESYNIYLNVIEENMKEAELRRYIEAGFSYQFLLKDEYRVFLSAKNLLAEKESLSIDDFESLTYYTYQRTLNTVKAQILNPSKRIGLNNINDIFQAVADDKGAATFLYKMLGNNWYVRNHFVVSKPVDSLRLCPTDHYILWRDGNLSGPEKCILAVFQENYSSFF